MPPLLALALCTVIVFALLRFEHKQGSNATRALWIPTIWLLYVASKPLGVWFQVVRTDPDAGSPMDQVFLIVLMFFALIVLARRKAHWIGALRGNPWLIALLVFMLISVIWSDIPGISFKRWIREFQAILMALVLLSEPFPRKAMESVLRRATYILIPFSLVLIKYFPIFGVEYGRWSGEQMWRGVAQQKNGMASICIISAIYLIWSLMRRWQTGSPPAWKYQTLSDLLILVLTFYLLAGPRHSPFYSATSTYALVAGLTCFAWVYLRQKSRKAVRLGPMLAIMLVVIILGVASVFIGGSAIKLLASTAGRDATLTGRTEVWTSLLPVVEAKPIAGVGFGGFWTSKTRDQFKISGAHSGYLDVLLGVGFVGLILVSMFLISSCRQAYRELSKDLYWGLLWICYLTMSVVHNIGESSLDSFTTQLTAVLLFMAVSSSREFPEGREPEEAPEGGLDEAPVPGG